MNSEGKNMLALSSVQFSSVTELCLTLCDTMTAARQASLSITNSQSLLKLMPIELVMPSNHLILCYPFLLLLQSFPASGSFPMSQFFTSGGHSIGVSASTSILPMNIQDLFPLGWTGWTSLKSKGTSRAQFKSFQMSQFFTSGGQSIGVSASTSVLPMNTHLCHL